MAMRWVMALAAVVALAGGGAQAAAAAERQKVKVTQAAVNFLFLPTYVAQGKGFFTEEGLEVEQIATGGGGPQIAALLAQTVDFTVAGGTYQLTAMQQGKPTMGVLNLGLRNLIQFIMHRDVARERGVAEGSPWEQKLKALRGLTIGATRPGALTWQLGEYVIAQAGMAVQRDVKLIAVGAGPSALAALEQRKVDVVMEGIPVPQTAVERGYGMIFIDYVRGDDPSAREFMLQNLLVRPEYLREHPQTVRKMVRALLRSNRFIVEKTPEEAADAVAPFFPGMRRETMVAGVRSIRGTFPADGLLTEAALKATQDMMERMGELKRRYTLADVFTPEYLPKP